MNNHTLNIAIPVPVLLFLCGGIYQGKHHLRTSTGGPGFHPGLQACEGNSTLRFYVAIAYRGSLWDSLWSALLRGSPTTIVMVLAEGGHEGSLLKPPI